jgi:glycosyltransferase involved in cell wall biosynthesis
VRVALVSDFLEEGWPSMDLVSDMLQARLGDVSGGRVMPAQIRPRMKSPFDAIPWLGGTRFSQNADRVYGRFIQYPHFVIRQVKKFDVFHVVDHSYAHLVHDLPGARTVVTCHDLDAFRSLLAESPEQRSPLFRVMARHVLLGLQKAAIVTCDSEATRDGLLENGFVQADRAVLVRLGVDPVFTPEAGPGDVVAERLLGRPAGAVTEVLHVGSVVDRKRIDVLLEVFSRLRTEFQDARLVRVGGAFTADQSALAERLGVLGAVDVLPVLERDVVAAVYRRASVVLLPSEREGFGLPLIEALASGTPVVASDLSVLRELGGDATSYCKVGDVAGWADTVSELLRESKSDAAVRDRRRRIGVERASNYSWTECARRMVELYDTVLESSRAMEMRQ